MSHALHFRLIFQKINQEISYLQYSQQTDEHCYNSQVHSISITIYVYIYMPFLSSLQLLIDDSHMRYIHTNENIWGNFAKSFISVKL